jgi:putative spermidine/putrescine transport system permease protein
MTQERAAIAAVWVVALCGVVFLMAPILVVIAVSVSPTPVFDLPVDGLSWRWYQRIERLPDLFPALVLSAQIAAISSTIALLLGTAAAIAVVRGQFPGRDALAAFVVSPLMLPGLVIGIAMLQYFRGFGLRDAYLALVLAHIVITLPYVMRTVMASLQLFDFTLIDAARTLGCSYPRAILRVMVPSLAPAFLTGGLFAFLASFDNYPVSMFLTDVRNKTVPIQLLQYVEESPNPTVAAVSTMLILLAIVVLVICERLVGLRRVAG